MGHGERERCRGNNRVNGVMGSSWVTKIIDGGGHGGDKVRLRVLGSMGSNLRGLLLCEDLTFVHFPRSPEAALCRYRDAIVCPT